MRRHTHKFAGLALAAILAVAAVFFLGGRIRSLASNGDAGAITATGNMTIARASLTTTLLPSGKVLITGGFGGSGTESRPYSTAELYDPATGRFSPAGNMTVGRSGHTVTTLKSGKILLAGGWTGRYQAAGTAELYDPATGSFTSTGRMVVPRAGNTATLLADGRVLMVGGVDADENALPSAEIYDPSTGKFTLTGAMNEPRGAHTATLLKSGKVLIAGGGSGHYPSQTVYQSAELYDPATGRFSRTGNMEVGRHKHAALLLPNGKVLVVGGSDNRDWRGEYSSAELYDPTRGTFTPTANMSLKRFKLPGAVAMLRNGKVLVAGGGERAEIYDPSTGTFDLTAGSLESARFFASATLLADGQVLIAGGYNDDSEGGLPSTARAWIYRPSASALKRKSGSDAGQRS